MSDNNSGNGLCPQCDKEFPPETIECPDDGSVLVHAKPDKLIGTVFADKYEILSLLGEGGMSRVYKARHKFMKRIVAIKILHESATRDPAAKARFQQEAEASSALSHRNVVGVYDFGFTHNGQAYFVMDCLEGKSLAELLEDKVRLPVAQGIDYFLQACEGLEDAHGEGIVHRDIKPSNLVISQQKDGSDLVKLVDFGIAKVMKITEGEKPQQLTQAGEIFGTPAYMSPEQCNGGKVDERSDIYSFGCLMYEALAGEPPLVGDTFINTVVKHISEKPKPFAEKTNNLNVPPHIEAVILKCLEKNPEDRYQSVKELKLALVDAAIADNVKLAQPLPNATGSNTGSHEFAGVKESGETKQQRQLKIILTVSVATTTMLLIAVSAWWLFLFNGPEGDSGTLFSKMLWQRHLTVSDDLIRDKQYNDAIKELEEAKKLAEKFGDNKSRLETTLKKLSNAYGKARRYSDQEEANKALSHLSTEKVYSEYDNLMELLKSWQTVPASRTDSEERAQQAAAFSDIIARCADKLSIRSVERQELLLKKAIAVFDKMEIRDWRSTVRFRLSLAECFRGQGRGSDQRRVLKEAIAACPKNPDSKEAWKMKIQAVLALGQLDRNENSQLPQFNHARDEIEQALSWTREHLPDDKETLRDALNGMILTYDLYERPEYTEKANKLKIEVKKLEATLDKDADKLDTSP